MFKTNMISIFKTAAIFVLSCYLLLGFCYLSVFAQTVNQGYKSDTPLQKGMLVIEKSDDPTKVELATQDKLERLKGVIVQQNDSPVTLAGEGHNVFVATTGEYEVLVSDENGAIKKGDYLSVSSLAGISMKAAGDQSFVIGRASADFKGEGDSVGTSVDKNTKKTVHFGRIQAAVSISRNPGFKEAKSNSIPKLLEKVSVSISGKPVPTARIWLATAVFLGSIIVTGVMLYSGARGSLISVGRNPLSKSAIIKGLLQVVVLSMIIFITGMFGVYLLLKL